MTVGRKYPREDLLMGFLVMVDYHPKLSYCGDPSRLTSSSFVQVPRDDRAKLVQELLRLIKGKVPAIAMKHDASRVVQTALQFGNREVTVPERQR